MNFARKIPALVVSIWAAFSLSCSHLPWSAPKTPTLHFQTKTGATVDQKGDAAKPATVSEATTHEEIALPAGSKIEVVPASASDEGKISINLAKDSALTSVTETSRVQGPTAAPPPSPPSPAELARGNAVAQSYYLAGGLTLLALLLFYLQHTKAALMCFLGAVAVPIVANLLTNSVALIVGGAFLLVALTLYAAWHLHMQSGQLVPQIQATVETLEKKVQAEIADSRK